MSGYPTNVETPLEALTTYLTPNDLFFVRHHWNPTVPDIASWRLVVDGDVERPLRLSLAELKQMPQTAVTCVLQCAGAGRSFHRPAVPGLQWGHGAVGNARWTGVRVRDLLDRAGVRATAQHLHAFGSDQPPGKVPPFHRSLELVKALEHAVVAHTMNGAPLPPLHGAPARLVVPGWAGDHWMKWLVRVSAQAQPQTGFYMDTAYRFPKQPGAPGAAVAPQDMEPVRDLAVKSLITAIPKRARVGQPIVARGVAYSGASGISKVEISDDDGASWQPAELDARHDPFAWRLWTFRYTPARAGRATLRARATDRRGDTQPREAVWNPSGYLHNAWHSVEIEVST